MIMKSRATPLHWYKIFNHVLHKVGFNAPKCVQCIDRLEIFNSINIILI